MPQRGTRSPIADASSTPAPMGGRGWLLLHIVSTHRKHQKRYGRQRRCVEPSNCPRAIIRCEAVVAPALPLLNLSRSLHAYVRSSIKRDSKTCHSVVSDNVTAPQSKKQPRETTSKWDTWPHHLGSVPPVEGLK